MKAMTDYMDPDYLTFDTNEVKPYWEAGEVALMNGWGSRASAFIDPEGRLARHGRAHGLRGRSHRG